MFYQRYQRAGETHSQHSKRKGYYIVKVKQEHNGRVTYDLYDPQQNLLDQGIESLAVARAYIDAEEY